MGAGRIRLSVVDFDLLDRKEVRSDARAKSHTFFLSELLVHGNPKIVLSCLTQNVIQHDLMERLGDLAESAFNVAGTTTSSPASAAMMACTSDNMAKSAAMMVSMPDTPGKMAANKEMSMANTDMSMGKMKSACGHYMKAQKAAMMK